jgi:hypothetical protein
LAKVIVMASGAAYDGSSLMELRVDGKTVGKASVTASHAKGAWQKLEFAVDLDDAQDLAVAFVNDASGGTSSQDRNLWIASVQVDEVTLKVGDAEYLRDGMSPMAGRSAMYWNGEPEWDLHPLMGVASAASSWAE